MKAITSKDNPVFKSLKKLENSAKERRETNKTLLDGLHLIEVYCEQIDQPELIVLSQTSATEDSLHHFLANWDLLSKVIVLPDTLYHEISSVKSPTGIVALITIPTAITPSTQDSGVLLENIQDPGNVGAILRCAAAAGLQQIYLSTGCVDVWAPKVLRAGMGAHFCLHIQSHADLTTIATQWNGVRIATQAKAPNSVFDVDLKKPTLFMIGNEGAGLTAELMDTATDVVSIPMAHNMESLNAACAASVCFFERVRQLKAR
jgi:TrmH family RNA methyltransferase